MQKFVFEIYRLRKRIRLITPRLISHHLRKLYIEKIINLSGNDEKYLHLLTCFSIFDVRNSGSLYLL